MGRSRSPRGVAACDVGAQARRPPRLGSMLSGAGSASAAAVQAAPAGAPPCWTPVWRVCVQALPCSPLSALHSTHAQCACRALASSERRHAAVRGCKGCGRRSSPRPTALRHVHRPPPSPPPPPGHHGAQGWRPRRLCEGGAGGSRPGGGRGRGTRPASGRAAAPGGRPRARPRRPLPQGRAPQRQRQRQRGRARVGGGGDARQDAAAAQAGAGALGGLAQPGHCQPPPLPLGRRPRRAQPPPAPRPPLPTSRSRRR